MFTLYRKIIQKINISLYAKHFLIYFINEILVNYVIVAVMEVIGMLAGVNVKGLVLD
jgi:hypothetical protein